MERKPSSFDALKSSRDSDAERTDVNQRSHSMKMKQLAPIASCQFERSSRDYRYAARFKIQTRRRDKIKTGSKSCVGFSGGAGLERRRQPAIFFQPSRAAAVMMWMFQATMSQFTIGRARGDPPLI